MLPNVVFDKTAFVKFNISNNLKQEFTKQIQNNQKSIGKSMPAYLKKKIRKPKFSRLFPNLCDFQYKKNHRLGYGFKKL
jgi:hypothetical protein